jgi:phage host-nuclease inhibitor protein Gam
MAKTNTRLKTKAQIYVPQSRDEAAADIRKIGDLQRQALRATTEMNDAIAHITQNFQPRPPSVSIRGQEAVIDLIKRLGLTRFIRTKEEVNKEAVLNEPDEVRGVAGLTVVTGVEDFVITPFEQEVNV